MTGPAGFLEFFILEASDYVEQLDGLLLRSGVTGPDGEGLQRIARALRGTATMAKLPNFADVASAIERVGRSLHAGAMQWDPALGGALVAAVDDLKILLHGARTWSPVEDQRATARAHDLAKYVPAQPTPTSSSTPSRPTSPPGAFLATEASNIAAGLELLSTRAGDAETASNVLRRVRALRGVAGVKEVAPLADVLEATENAARGLETHEEQISPEARQLFETAAAYLRTLSSALRGDGDVNAPSAAREAFNAALETLSGRSDERERVVPIDELFYQDGVPGVVEASQNPPTSLAERFRLELVSLGEHLRQVVDSARNASDTASLTRSRRDLRNALRALQAAALSFGEKDVASLVGEHADSANHVDFLGLAALEDLAKVIADPGVGGERLRARLSEISGGRNISSAIGAGFGRASTPAASAPAAQRPSAPSSPLRVETPAAAQTAHTPTPAVTSPAVSPSRAPTPARAVASASATPASTPSPSPIQTPAVATNALDSASASLIDSSIAALEALEDVHLSPAIEIPEDAIVPIETLLYRGRAALDRAVEIRDEIKRSGTTPDTEALGELFDLLELARAG